MISEEGVYMGSREKWVRHFAWFPVCTIHGRWRWLTYVWKQRRWFYWGAENYYVQWARTPRRRRE